MKKFKSGILVAALVALPVMAMANPTVVTISAPVNGGTTQVDTLPMSVPVTGSVFHSPGTINNMRACLSVDAGAEVCGPTFTGVGNKSSFTFNIGGDIFAPGLHTFKVCADKVDGGHLGCATVEHTFTVAQSACDEVDPPAIANDYMNGINLPNAFNQVRGKIINQIAANMNEGKYGTCNYNATKVKEDVDVLLAQAGWTGN
ncbi:hypothetical protein [Geomonas propionica]|uniref:Uncharacterized protein n=1 Tax=Geomonas propionica TaxID=2798582 RepID=A0ABS0YW10_9BACT|nr:hypothetical protein [Geomonas propionica]MBJ6802154.1 hypothetical protein [Geomonas propionica]